MEVLTNGRFFHGYFQKNIVGCEVWDLKIRKKFKQRKSSLDET